MVALTNVHGDQYTLTGFAKMEDEPTSTRSGWQEHLLDLEMGKECNIQLGITGSADQIKADIGMGHALTVSDRLYQQERGTVAWIIKGAMSVNHIQGSMITPGIPGDHSSFQSEATGLYGILLMLLSLQEKEHNFKGSIEIACNEKSVLE